MVAINDDLMGKCVATSIVLFLIINSMDMIELNIINIVL